MECYVAMKINELINITTFMNLETYEVKEARHTKGLAFHKKVLLSMSEIGISQYLIKYILGTFKTPITTSKSTED